MKEVRLRNYVHQIVINLRVSQPNLAEYTDDQIDKAHRNWSSSDDFPDESKLVDWIEPVEYE
jgi:hypothetical protein